MDDISALQKVPMFAHLDSDELAGLHAVMEAEQFAPHTVIIREGEPGDKFYVVLAGNVQFSVHTADGVELVDRRPRWRAHTARFEEAPSWRSR